MTGSHGALTREAARRDPEGPDTDRTSWAEAGHRAAPWPSHLQPWGTELATGQGVGSWPGSYLSLEPPWDALWATLGQAWETLGPPVSSVLCSKAPHRGPSSLLEASGAGPPAPPAKSSKSVQVLGTLSSAPHPAALTLNTRSQLGPLRPQNRVVAQWSHGV